MKSFRILSATLFLLLLVAVGASLVRSPMQAAPLVQEQLGTKPETVSIPPGNYCVGCHMPDDPVLADTTAWQGGIARLSIVDCPAQADVEEQIYYTERVLLAIDRLQAGLGGAGTTQSIEARKVAELQGYARLLDEPVVGLDAFVSEAQVLRYNLVKVQTRLNDQIEARKKSWVLWASLGITLVVLVSLGWGYRNTLRLAVTGGGAAPQRGRFWLRGAVIAVLVFILFALPLFKVYPAPVEEASAEAQEVQTTLDEASRRATRADTAQARAWMMARVGAEWQSLDVERGEESLEEARSAALEITEEAPALWGEMQAAQEAAAGTAIDMENAGLIAAQLAAARGRAWSARMMAAEWLPVDEETAREILLWAEQIALANHDPYRDLDLRAIALQWSALDLEQAERVMMMVDDPSVGAWGWRELGARSGDASLYDLAAEEAAEIENPAVRALAYIRLAKASGQADFLVTASGMLDETGVDQKAFLMAEIAAVSKDRSLVEQIDPTYPEASTLAYLSLGDYELAWEEAGKINDPYDRARAQSRIATEAGDAELASQIEVPILRDRAMYSVILKTRDASLVANIDSPYYQVAAYTGLGDYESALELGEDLRDGYPLIELALALAGKDTQAAKSVVDMMDLEADKTKALTAIAAASGESEDFERALGMALAARVRSHPLSPSIASLDLAHAMVDVNPEMAQAAFEQAFEAVESLTIK